MAQVSNVFIAVERRKAMKPVDLALAVTDRGLEGCHTWAGRKQTAGSAGGHRDA